MNWTRTTAGAIFVLVAVLNTSLCLRGFLQGWFGTSWWHYSIVLASLCLLFGGLLTFCDSRWIVPIIALLFLLSSVLLFSWEFGLHFWERYPAGGLLLVTILVVGTLAYSFSSWGVWLAAIGSVGLLISDTRDLRNLFAIRMSRNLFPYRAEDVDRTLIYESALLILDILCLVCCAVLARKEFVGKANPVSRGDQIQNPSKPQ
jgi:hypothetical protein